MYLLAYSYGCQGHKFGQKSHPSTCTQRSGGPNLHPWLTTYYILYHILLTKLTMMIRLTAGKVIIFGKRSFFIPQTERNVNWLIWFTHWVYKLHSSIGIQVTQVNWYTSYTGQLVYKLHRSVGVLWFTQVNWYTSYTGQLVYCGLHRSIGVQATQVYWCISYTGQLVYLFTQVNWCTS